MLVSLIEKQGGECSITEYASADAYLSDGKEHDLIFLDIEMGGYNAGLDGWDWQGISGAWRCRNSPSSFL